MANILFENPPVSYQPFSSENNPVIWNYLSTIQETVCRKSTFVVFTLLVVSVSLIVLLLVITKEKSTRRQTLGSEYSAVFSTEDSVTHHNTSTVTVTQAVHQATPIICNISAINATWSKPGIVFADLLSQCTMGDKQQCLLHDLFIDQINSNLYVVDSSDNRIHKYSLTDPLNNGQVANGTVVASEGLISPSSIFVDAQTEDMYILDYNKAKISNPQEPATYRVHLWPKNSSTGRIILQEVGEYLYGLYSYIVLDKEKNIYVDTRYHVRKWYASTDYTQVITVAGSRELGQKSADQLFDPRGLHIDDNFTLYIVDWNNQRIQKWLVNSQEGTTLASNLLYPYGITQDCQGNIYYSDIYRNAVYQLNVVTNQTATIISNDGGIQNDQNSYISSPYAMKFDKFGNLFVIDGRNSRIKKFTIT